jgi:ribosome-associated translation inhibitor RaiA
LEKAIARKVDKVEERLKRYHPDAADLEIRLERQEKLNSFDCAIQLRAFRETLHSRKSSPELRVAVDKSFDALMKELDHYRVRINKSLQS